MKISGFYQDTIRAATSRREVRAFRSNLVVSNCYSIVAALMRGQPRGELWWAVGAGSATWSDENPPLPRSDDTRLTAELRRQRVVPEQLSFVDERGVNVSHPTPVLEVRAGFASGGRLRDRASPEPGPTLREFGLFIGDDASLPNTGTLINHAIHPAITLAPGEILERRLRLDFGAATHATPGFGAFGRELLVSRIKGIDDRYARALQDAGVVMIDDLARLDAARRPPAIPPARFVEFVEKARSVRAFRPLTLLNAFAELTLWELIETSPSALVARATTPTNEEDALDAQRSVQILVVALDVGVLRGVRVRELLV